MEDLQANLTQIQQRLAAATEGKYPVPKLIAVTKTHPAEAFCRCKISASRTSGKIKCRKSWKNCLRWRRIFGFTSSEGCNPIK